MHTFTNNTIADPALVNENFQDLANGDEDTTANSLRTFRDEAFFDFVQTGCVWTGDSLGSNRNASMTAGVVFINGRRIVISSVTARTFTASRDTYVDILDNLDGTGTLVYTEVTNNNASIPALAANSMRIAIIVTAAGSIAAAGSINQGQEDRVVPIVSSVPFTTTDSSGNLICPRDPNSKQVGYRQRTSDVSSSSGTPAQVTELSCPVKVIVGKKLKITVEARFAYNNTTGAQAWVSLWDGSVGGTKLDEQVAHAAAANGGNAINMVVYVTPTSASKTYNVGFATNGVGTATMQGASTYPISFSVEYAS
jgi:hypothetical protein